MVLGESFEEAASDAVSAASTAIDPPKSFVARALNSYQAKNGPETRALIEAGEMRGAPYQYNPAVENDETGQKILDGKRASAVVSEQGNARAVAEAGDSHDDGFSFEFP